MERVLVNGTDARAHSIARKIQQTSEIPVELIFPNVNAGTAKLGKSLDLDLKDYQRQVRWARDNKVKLVYISSENELGDGSVDQFQEAGLLTFGPTKEQGRIEFSKITGVKFNRDLNIPQPLYRDYQQPIDALTDLVNIHWPIVVKADGLAGGKGVVVAGYDRDLAAKHLKDLDEGKYSGSGKSGVVLQEQVEGSEVSGHCFVDRQGNYVIMPYSQDHKKRFNEDHQGHNPNTGGKGAYAPVPWVNDELQEVIRREIFEKAIKGLREAGLLFGGHLFPGIMVTKDGPKVLEWGVRSGSPETEALMMLFQGDLLEVMKACAAGRLDPNRVSFRRGYGVAVVLEALQASCFPDEGREISGLDGDFGPNVQVFQSRTKFDGNKVVTTGLGRILSVAGFGPSLQQGLGEVYYPLHQRRPSLPGQHYRTDVAWQSAPRRPTREERGLI